jgi:hypothetical protein
MPHDVPRSCKGKPAFGGSVFLLGLFEIPVKKCTTGSLWRKMQRQLRQCGFPVALVNRWEGKAGLYWVLLGARLIS